MSFKCDYCPSRFVHKTGKIRHMRDVCNNRPGRSTSSQTDLPDNETIATVSINSSDKTVVIKLKNERIVESSDHISEEEIAEPTSIKSVDNSDQSNLTDTIKKLCERMDRMESQTPIPEKQKTLINLKDLNIY